MGRSELSDRFRLKRCGASKNWNIIAIKTSSGLDFYGAYRSTADDENLPRLKNSLSSVSMRVKLTSSREVKQFSLYGGKYYLARTRPDTSSLVMSDKQVVVESFDLEDRDPKCLNQHIEVTWDNIIGEPQSIRSPECAWTTSQFCFKYSMLAVYTCLTVFVAPIATCLIGTVFAFYHFMHIWFAVPSLRLCKISCGMTRAFVQVCTHGVVIPITEAIGYIFSKIRLKLDSVREPEIREIEEEILIV